MLINLIKYLDSFKSIGIFGYGIEGKSFEYFMQKYLSHIKIIIIDKKDGDDYMSKLFEPELIVKSPGISLYNLDILYKDFNFTSGTELFLRFFRKNTIGVTGTKGKSTLCTIIQNILKNDNQKSFLCGNIGIPVFDIIDKIDPTTLIVLELSSHQLEHISYSPHIAILINLFEDHLDYYKDCNTYYKAKYNIFKYQIKDDIAIVNFDKVPKNVTKNVVCKRFRNSYNSKLKYHHNFNITKGFIHKSSLQILEAFVELLQIPQEVYIYTINEFKTLPHRLEYIEKKNNIIFINDSISTIPETTIEAIRILKDVDTLILGGFDRGINYNLLVEFLVKSGVTNIILYSTTGRIIENLFGSHNKNINYVKTLKETIPLAFSLTKPEKICLFSPAASSFDSFENFMVRGEYFKNQIKDNNQ